jgi:hypothetical protein
MGILEDQKLVGCGVKEVKSHCTKRYCFCCSVIIYRVKKRE